jgi:hypothetical protein
MLLFCGLSPDWGHDISKQGVKSNVDALIVLA